LSGCGGTKSAGERVEALGLFALRGAQQVEQVRTLAALYSS
jgi:hypothetical protein